MMLGDDAGREGVRQEAQGPVPAVTQNCRETSEGLCMGLVHTPAGGRQISLKLTLSTGFIRPCPGFPAPAGAGAVSGLNPQPKPRSPCPGSSQTHCRAGLLF